MRLIFLIGWPGVGKSTVGSILAERTGFPLFDNYFSYREICRFLPPGSMGAHVLNVRLRRVVLAALLNAAVPGVICTLAIQRNPVTRFTRLCIEDARRAGARVDFVKLVCDWQEHKRRVQHPSRRRFTKICTVQLLLKKMGEPAFLGFSTHPPLVVDNTRRSGVACAEQIINLLHLPRRKTG